MEIERWKRLEEIFDAVVDLGPASRRVRILELCPGDEKLQAETTELCEAWDEIEGSDDSIEDVIRRAVTDASAEILAERARRQRGDRNGIR